MTATKDMTEGTPWKLILSFLLPVLLGLLLQQLYHTVDTIIVGNFAGETALAAVGTTHSMALAFLAVSNGLSQGACVSVAQLFGAKDMASMKRCGITAILFLLGLSIIFTGIGIGISFPVLKYLLDAEGEMLHFSAIYFQIYSLGMLFQFGYNVVSGILRGLGDSKATLYFLIISSVINILLDLLFVGPMHMGVQGAALATIISEAASCVAAFLYMFNRYEMFRIRRKDLSFDLEHVRSILKNGMPITLQQLAVSFGFVFIQRAVNSFGQAMTASFTVGQRIETYLGMPSQAMMNTLASFTGQNIGAGKIERVKKGAMQSLVLSGLITFTLSGICFIFTLPIVRAFNLGSEAFSYCVPHLHTVELAFLLYSLYFPLLGVFQGSSDGFVATISAILGLTARVLTVYLFVGIIGKPVIWWNIFSGFVTGCIYIWTLYLTGHWKKKIKRIRSEE